MEKKLLTTQILAGILLVVLLVSVWFNLKLQRDLKTAETNQSLSVARDQIRLDCQGTTPEARALCVKDLQDLSDTLSTYMKAMATQGTSSTH